MSCNRPRSQLLEVSASSEAEPLSTLRRFGPLQRSLQHLFVDHIIFLSLPFSTIVWHDVGTPSPSREDVLESTFKPAIRAL